MTLIINGKTYEAGELIAHVKNLEKENAELEQKLEQTEKDLTDYQFNYPTIKELEKENKDIQQSCENYYNEMRSYKNKVAELEKENAREKNERNAFKIYSDGAELDAINLNEQLTKAKELLRDVLPYIDLTNCVNSDPRLVLYDKIKSLIEENE